MALSNFNISDYQEKYRWTGLDTHGDAVQLRILEKTSTPYTVKAIRCLVDIHLQMQGAQNRVFDPITKTALMFTLIDAPDLSDATTKAGNWQEFFTPDATAYLVQVYRGGSVEWQGFITPDSWQESLSYRGAITITARDNIGHCSDIPFDKSAVTVTGGLACIRDLIEQALDEVYFPMALLENVNTGDCQTLRDTHGYILDGYVAVSEFEGKSWGEVLEECLHAIGYTLRYVSGNSFALAPIRNIPLGLSTTRAQAQAIAYDIEFYGGNRELDPAIRQITEKVDFGGEMEIDVVGKDTYKYGATTANTYSGSFQRYDGYGSQSFTGRSWKNGNTDFATKGGWSDTFGYLNPQRCVASNVLKTIDGGDSFRSVALLADQNTDGGVLPAWRVKAPTTDVTLRLEFARPIKLSNGSFPFTVDPFFGYLKQIKALVSYIDPNGVKWGWQTFNGVNDWTSGPSIFHTYDIVTDAPTDFPDSFALDIPLKDISDKTTLGGWLQIEFYNFIHVGAPGTIYGLFARVTSIKATLNNKSVLKSDTITTVNNQAYNVKLERKPAFGAMSAQVPYLTPANYPKALWTDDSGKFVPMDYKAYLNGYAASTAIPLPAQIHKQMLCYNFTPLEILEGTCGLVNKAAKFHLGHICNYKGKEFVIQGGTLDVLKNRISGVHLHEFAWYADLWDENNNPTYNGNPKYETDSTLNGANGNSAIASSGSGGGGGTGTVTSVALAAPTGFQVTGSPITTSGTLQLSYASGYSLPLTADTAKGVQAYNWGNHANQGYIKDAAGIITALGYVPASATSSFQAPKLKIVSGYESHLTFMVPKIICSHPLIGTSDACFVLMVYRKRRGKCTISGGHHYKQRREKWGEARGPLATGSALTSTYAFQLDTIREWVLNRYMCIEDYALPTNMTVAQLNAITTYGHSLRFGRLANYTGTSFKAKTKGWLRFGIAVRITNPLWTAHANPGAVETTRQMKYNGEYIDRYLYSDVAPLRIFAGSDENKLKIGFSVGQP